MEEQPRQESCSTIDPEAGPGTRGRGHSLSFTSYFAATLIGQTHLKAKEPVTQSMGPQSLDQGKEK